MGFATHLGPWLLGTVKETTGTTAGLIRNTGATLATQTTKVSYAGAVFGSATTTQIAVLPAGAHIFNILIDTLTAFTGSTAANLTIGYTGSVNAYWTTSDITSQGRSTTAPTGVLVNWAGTATTAAPNGQGVGTSDVIVNAYLTPTIANVTAGIVQYTIVYGVANFDGTFYPVSA
jgi:hypothetical protein